MNTMQSLRYSFYVPVHPFDGFWDLKHEKKGKLWIANLWVALTVIMTVAGKLSMAVLFNEHNGEKISFPYEACAVLFLLFLWCGVNWCVTTLLDGEGSFKDIYMYSAYALVPYVLLKAVQMVLSHVLSLDEKGILTFLGALTVIWVGGLLFFGTLVTHDYSFGKTVGVILLIIASVVVILFVGLLLVYILQQMWNFGKTIYTEIVIRR